ncbi:lipoyl(octanoyl) transferase LipB [Phaeovibrio sulfidiphilus]|uniref:Octanoyltransferase n=1 Tax=Phaeovibrio sulfidiphilus TaxID=1220600 RepID=A0A8J6YKQ9_9PROT|nr:lipoyl(octanoyl) transferase LipB [Phaeovibrio sulfidiphilus]
MEWFQSETPVPYPEALAFMEERVRAIRAGDRDEAVWLLEHPPLYTAGTGARVADLLEPERFPVYAAGRGGQYTYHGPGQRVAYVMLDLDRRGRDIRAFVWALEEWLIRTLAVFSVVAERREGRVGLWVADPGGSERKIAAIGIRVRQWVSFHGIALNVCPDLSHFGGIVPCGLGEYGVTSLRDLGLDVPMARVDEALRAAFGAVFGQPDGAGAEVRPPRTDPRTCGGTRTGAEPSTARPASGAGACPGGRPQEAVRAPRTPGAGG